VIHKFWEYELNQATAFVGMDAMGLKKVKALLARNIQLGRNPKALSASVALGSVLGLFPIPGVATGMCLVAAIVLRLNPVVLQAVNYAVYPLQIGMLGVYYALGNLWFGPIGALQELRRLPELARQDLLAGFQSLGQVALPVMGAWLLTGPLIGFMLYVMVRPAVYRLVPVAVTGNNVNRQSGRHQR